MERLRAARDKWCTHGGGGDFDAHFLEQEAQESDQEGDVQGHHEVRARRGKPFRLKARAFMLTFNSLAFAASPELWASFQQWVEERKERYRATYWSATGDFHACRGAPHPCPLLLQLARRRNRGGSFNDRRLGVPGRSASRRC